MFSMQKGFFDRQRIPSILLSIFSCGFDAALFSRLVLFKISFSPVAENLLVCLFSKCTLPFGRKGLLDRDKIRFPHHKRTKRKKHVTSPERFKLEKYKKVALENRLQKCKWETKKKLILIA